MTSEASKKELAFIKDYILKDKGRLNIFLKFAFEIIKRDLERLKKLEEVLIILNLSYEWKLEVQEFEDGNLGYFIYSPYGEGYYNITEDQYNNFKEVLEYIKTLE